MSVPGSSYCWLVIIAWHDFQHFQALANKSSANCPWKTAFLSQVRARPGTIFTDGNYVTWCAFQQKTYLCHIPRHVVLQRWHAVWNDIVERLYASAAWSVWTNERRIKTSLRFCDIAETLIEKAADSPLHPSCCSPPPGGRRQSGSWAGPATPLGSKWYCNLPWWDTPAHTVHPPPCDKAETNTNQLKKQI